jgi:Tfp pilus assembly protein PilZ
MGYTEFRRRYERKMYSADVIFSVRGMAFAGTLKDVSVGGAFVFTLSVNQVGKGDVVTLNIPYTSGKGSIKRRAKVVWITGEGFAVEFL